MCRRGERKEEGEDKRTEGLVIVNHGKERGL